MAIRYLTVPQVGEYIGVSRGTMQKYQAIMPVEDARIGTLPVWLPDTIDQWNQLRPGRRPSTENRDWLKQIPPRPVIEYLAGPQIAERLNMSRSTIAGYRRRDKFPPPDATTDTLDGWLPQSIDAWNARRPGKRPTRDGENWHLPPEYSAS